jgi:hypothetical protein
MPIDTARPRNDAWLGLRAIEANGRGVGPLADIVDVPSPSKFALGDASLEATRQKNWLLANFDPTALFPDEAGTFFFGSRSKVAAQATDATEAEAHVARAVPAHAPSLNADAAASPIPLYTAPARDIPTGANQTLTVGGARTTPSRRRRTPAISCSSRRFRYRPMISGSSRRRRPIRSARTISKS